MPGLAHRAAEAVLLDARARASARREPAISAPSGQPRPFERQSVTVSNGAPISAAGTPSATAAFSEPRAVEVHARARARARSRRRARSSSSGQTVPPAVLCVFSSATTDVRGVWKLPSREHRRADLVGREPPELAGEPACLQPGVHRGAAELGDHDVRRLLDDSSVPRSPRIGERDLVAPSSRSAGRPPPPGRAARRRGARARGRSDPRAPARRRPPRVAIASRIAGDGLVWVSERRSIIAVRANEQPVYGVPVNLDLVAETLAGRARLPGAPGVGMGRARRGVVRGDDEPAGRLAGARSRTRAVLLARARARGDSPATER